MKKKRKIRMTTEKEETPPFNNASLLSMIPNLNGHNSLDFFDNLSKISLLGGWSEVQLKVITELKLEGKARKYFESVLKTQNLDFLKLKEAFIQHFTDECLFDTHLAKFSSATQGEYETVKEFSVRLEGLAIKCFDAKQNDGQEQVSEEFKIKLLLNHSYAVELVQRLQTSFKTIKSNLEQAQCENQKYNSPLPRSRMINVGDLVYLSVPQIKKNETKKLTKMNQGPFRVIDKITPVLFNIVNVTKPANKQTVHLNRIIKVVERKTFPEVLHSSPEDDAAPSQNNDSKYDEVSFSDEFPCICLPFVDNSWIENCINKKVNKHMGVVRDTTPCQSPATNPSLQPPTVSTSAPNPVAAIPQKHDYELRKRNVSGFVKYKD